MRGVRGCATPEKRFAVPWAFEFFGQGIGQISRLRLGKFTFIFKKLSIFKILTVLRKTVETSSDPRLACLLGLVYDQ